MSKEELYKSIEIINESSKFIPFNLTKAVRSLLKYIPNDHLIGLGSIVLLDGQTSSKSKYSIGTYLNYKQGPSKIELSISGIYGPKPFWPCLIPFVRKFMLAKVLFHEVGHHCRRIVQGKTKRKEENFAEKYSKKYVVKALYYWFYFLKPFRHLFLWLGRPRNRITK